MNNNIDKAKNTDSITAEKQEEAKQYKSPKLINYGKLVNITLGESGGINDTNNLRESAGS